MGEVIEAMTRFLDDKVGEFVPSIAGDSTFEALEVDSLVLVELTVAMERRFGVTVADGDLRPAQTIEEAAAVVDALRPPA